MYHKISYSNNGPYNDLSVEVIMNENIKIPDQSIDKALMIAMNYLLENLEIEVQEDPE